MKEYTDKYQVLKEVFGYSEFREGQETLIDSVLSGRDAMGIMPTGSGKSLCFQVPALLLDGVTLVISPLISLMKDQVTALNEAGVHAAYINSSLTEGQYRKAMENMRNGQYKIVYAAPERLMTASFLYAVKDIHISMVAVDEAHCISQWGQDFRPGYLKIMDFIRKLPVRPVLTAYTATATDAVREDIRSVLELQNPAVALTGYDRKNLYFEVRTPGNKSRELLNYLSKKRGMSGIIYCNTRKHVDEVCGMLVKEGYPATRYHAGLTDKERRENQEDFLYDRAPVMVATNAFGMGIDKPDVRYVVHYNMPKDIESYYQEAGRAGRDGEPAECILLYGAQDVVTNQFFIDHNRDNDELDGETRRLVTERDRERLRKMTFFCFTSECLRDYILRYFGEYGNHYCGNCSNCLGQFEQEDMTGPAKGLIGCVESSRQRYGANVIIDTLHGANTAKIRGCRMDENPHYGEFAKVPVYKLRQVMNYLQLNEYLTVTNDEYAVVKLTHKSASVLDGDEQIIMKMAKEPETKEKAGKAKNGRPLSAAGRTGKEESLFERLRSLRRQIAREEKVPPYIVFSDKTLTHMCIVRPETKSEMLSVTGVGEYKYEKYGERFLSCVRETADTPERL